MAAGLLALDRTFGMHFFTNDAGGNMMMYANLLWIWGHPEVYILILPAFGVYSSVVTTFSERQLFGYTSLVYATCAIAILSFTVWLHHFFTMGSSASVNAFFGIATMVIAVPTGVKIFDWLFTMYRGRIRFSVPMLYTLAFIVTFVIGGVTGVLLALPPADYLMHNTTFLVAHFHNMVIPGALFGYLAGLNFWFPKAFGFRLDERWGRRSFWCWVIGFYLAFMPLYVLGFYGHAAAAWSATSSPEWQPWLIVAALGAVFILFALVFLATQIVVSIRRRDALRDPTGDPWGGFTLEWSTTSPPPPWNFATASGRARARRLPRHEAPRCHPPDWRLRGHRRAAQHRIRGAGGRLRLRLRLRHGLAHLVAGDPRPGADRRRDDRSTAATTISSS